MIDDTYTVLGLDDAPAGHVELHSAESHADCHAWVRGYTRSGDFGGYYGLAIVSPDGEWIAVFNAPEQE